MPADTQPLAILVMEESDSSRTYYRLPDHWLAAVDDPAAELPEDLVAAYTAEYGVSPAAGAGAEFAIRTRQVLAIDAHYLGDSLSDVVAHADGRDVREIHGTWF